MKKIYKSPKIEIVEIDSDVNLMSGSMETCDCKPHRGNHDKCGNGCHTGEAVGHDDNWNGWE